MPTMGAFAGRPRSDRARGGEGESCSLTSIPFSIAQADLHVRLKIYSVAGRLVRTLVDGPLPAGPQEVVWDGTDTHQHPVASGVYVYLLETPDFRAHSKLVLVR